MTVVQRRIVVLLAAISGLGLATAWLAMPVVRTHAAPSAMTPWVYLPIGQANGPFGPPPVAVTAVPTLPPTATATEPPPPTATSVPTETATPTPSPTPTEEGYSEPLTSRASLDDLKSGYNASLWYETMLEILKRRYGTGHHLVTQLTDSKAKAAQWTSGRTSSFADLVGALELAVHEMNHQLGIQEGFLPSFGKEYFYEIRADLQVKVTVVPTFNRSEIAQFVTGPLENQYKSVYLTGQSGQQGYFTLLDEFNAYTHSLFTGYGVYDLYPTGQRVSHRDGMVTMMMYNEFYLRRARTNYPIQYASLRNDPAVRALVATLWDRANFILDKTESIPALALNPTAVEAEMRKADMQAEVVRFLGP
jgi:hypothetical protein